MIDRRTVLALACLTILCTPALADCKGDLNAALSLFQAGKPFHTQTMVTVEGQSMMMEADVLLPDRMRMRGPQGTFVMTKSGVWMDHGGAFMKMPADLAAMMREGINNGISHSATNLKNIKCLGKQAFEGGTYLAYSYATGGQMMGVKSTGKVTLYVDGAGAPAWQVIVGNAKGKTSTTVQKITFDPRIKIEDPK